MTCRVLGLIKLKNKDAFGVYRDQVAATVTKYGGQIQGRRTIVDMPWNELNIDTCEAIVEIEFPTAENATQWAESPEYRSLLTIRSEAMNLALFISQ